jgi:hypothetical protein
MNRLLFTYKLLELIARLGIVSNSVIRSVRPNTYTFYCVYSEEKVNNNNLAGSKNINTCGSLDCKYYRRLVYNAGGVAGGVTTTVASSTAVIGVGSTAAGGTTTSLLVALGVACPLAIAAIATVGVGTYLIARGSEDTIRGIENELKLE